MTSKFPWIVVALLSFFALSAVGADVSGKWVAQVPGFQGDTMELTFTFKVEGARLTGTLGSPMGEQPISEGKVSGDDISFVMVFTPPDGGGGPGGGMKIVFKGKVAGDEIKMTQTFEGGPGGEGMPPQEYVAKRAK